MWSKSGTFAALLLLFHGAFGDEYEEYGEPEEYDGPKEYYGINCEDGIYLPLPSGVDNLDSVSSAVYGIIFFLVLLYYILGICIYLNKLMESLETITSQMKSTTVQDPETGEKKDIIVRVWSSGLANMVQAVGSSIPLILLGFAELLAKNFMAGDIAPGAILGSSSFNLLLGIGILICVVPQGQARKVRNLAGLILFAVLTWIIYAWIYSAVALFSYGMVEIWEVVVTLILFCLTFVSTVLVLTFVGRRSKVETSLEEYKANFALYQSIRKAFKIR